MCLSFLFSIKNVPRNLFSDIKLFNMNAATRSLAKTFRVFFVRDLYFKIDSKGFSEILNYFHIFLCCNIDKHVIMICFQEQQRDIVEFHVKTNVFLFIWIHLIHFLSV